MPVMKPEMETLAMQLEKSKKLLLKHFSEIPILT